MRGGTMRLKVRVSPGARRSAIIGRYGDAWKVRVAEPAESGRANDAVIRLLTRTLGVDIRLVAGRRARDKVVALEIDEARAERLLAAAAGKGRE